MTKAKFLAVYREYIVKTYGWTADAAKLEHFMGVVKETLLTECTTWGWNADATKVAWKAIGGKGKVTLKALRALPER